MTLSKTKIRSFPRRDNLLLKTRHNLQETMLSALRTTRLSAKHVHVRSFANWAVAQPPPIATDDSLSAFEQSVGGTKMVRLKWASEETGCNVYGKCEFENPGGSIKDRAATWMVKDAEARGVLKRGEPGVIIEGTAGNTGIGLALAAAIFGYKCVICIAETQSIEKKNMLRWAGAHLVEVPAVPYKNPNNYVHIAKRLAEALGESGDIRTFYANQWDNLANRQAHIDGTGPEIWAQLQGNVDAFSCAMGTGGTLSGVAEFLRSVKPDVKIGLTDPCGAALYRYFTQGELGAQGSSISEGIGQGRITGNIEGFKPDLAFEIPDEEMMPVLQNLQKLEGLSVGGSAGINVAGAIRMAKELGPGHNVVTVLCDSGSRYASKLYNPQFLRSKQLQVPSWLAPGAEDKKLFDHIDAVAQSTIVEDTD